MKGITWARDSHGLFDYESRHLTKFDILLASRILYQQYQAIQKQKGIWADAQFLTPVDYRKLR